MKSSGAGKICAFALCILLAACGSSHSPASAPGGGSKAAECALFAPDDFVTRNDLAAGGRRDDARLLLRFVQFTDDHIMDDDGQAINGASVLDPLHPTFESAQRYQDEYTDEVMNDMIGRVNQCHAQYPAEFMIVTGDSADITTVAEIRRFIDNLDGSFDQLSAFEQRCRAALPAGSDEAAAQAQCTRFTGRGVADTQSIDPDINDLTYQLLPTRTVRQILDTESAAISGRAADGSVDLARQTATRAPGLPQVLRCHHGEPGCGNERLAMPWYVAFGNHDGYLRGTIALTTGINTLSLLTGRRYMLEQHDFIDEFFNTDVLPGPLGHGFEQADVTRRIDADGRNDGYYARDAGGGKFRLIVMNTIIDGFDPRIPLDLLRNPFALSDGSIDAAQFAWIKSELSAAWARKQLVLVFSHHPDLTFAEYGLLAPLVPIDVTAVQLDAELASWPNLLAWVAGHTHQNRIRPFKVTDGHGSNGKIEAEVACKQPDACVGFWQIETASLIDFPQEQRLLEIFDNGDGSGTIRAPLLTHGYEASRRLAEKDDRCQLYLSDPVAVASGISEAGLAALCLQGGTRQGTPQDRNVELMFRMPVF